MDPSVTPSSPLVADHKDISQPLEMIARAEYFVAGERHTDHEIR